MSVRFNEGFVRNGRSGTRESLWCRRHTSSKLRTICSVGRMRLRKEGNVYVLVLFVRVVDAINILQTEKHGKQGMSNQSLLVSTSR